jgi:spermidine/putrescine transport system permease protein
MSKLWHKVYMGIMFLFLYAPILVLIVFSFNQSKSRSKFTGFSLKWYEDLFENTEILNALRNTLVVAVLAALIATVLGTVAALGINNMKKKTKTLVMNVSYIQVINPDIITGISLMLMFVFIKNMFGLQLGFVTVLLSHITFDVPYVVLNVLPKLRQMDYSLYEASLDLGCPPTKSFFKAVMPQIMPGIISGCLMAFTFSLDDFVVTYFTAGSGYQTLTIAIEAMTKKQVSPEINALSTIIFVVVLTCLILMNLKDIKGSKKIKKERR